MSIKTYTLRIDAGIADGIWNWEFCETSDESAVKTATRMLQSSRIANAASMAALWGEDESRPALGIWHIQLQVELVPARRAA